MANNIDLLWGDENELGEESFLVSGDEQRYPRGWFASGHQMVYVDGDGDPKGWHFDESKMPGDMLAALRIMEGQGKAQRVSIRHNSNLVNYWTLTQPRYFLLAHGTPSYNQIQKAPELCIGLAAGAFTWENREDKGKLDTTPFVSVLAVEEGLYRAGYTDEQGVPKPIELRMTGLWKDEFYAELVKHVMLVKYAQDVLHLPKRQFQFWSLAYVITASDKKVAHTGGGKTTYVYTAQGRHPDKKQWNEAYIRSLYCGDELYALLFQLVMDMNATPRVPGGIAIQWSRELSQAAKDNQAQYISPLNGKTLPWGTIEKPEWLTMQAAAQKAGMLAPGYVASVNGGAPSPAAPKKTLFDDIREEFDNKLRYFKLIKKDEAGTKLVEEGLAILENKLGLSDTEVEQNALRKLEQAGVRQQELIAVPY